MKTVITIVSVIGVILLLVILSVVRLGCGVADRVVNPTAIVTNYEWFHDQSNAIEAQRQNLNIMASQVSTDKQRTELIGTAMVLNSMIAEYNSRSSQITRNLWKRGDIPYRLEPYTLPVIWTIQRDLKDTNQTTTPTTTNIEN